MINMGGTCVCTLLCSGICQYHMPTTKTYLYSIHHYRELCGQIIHNNKYYFFLKWLPLQCTKTEMCFIAYFNLQNCITTEPV